MRYANCRMRFSAFLLFAAALQAQVNVNIQVDAARTTGPFQPIYGYFGYDEPNYTYMAHGRELLGELANLSASPVFIRTHFMLATGNGTPGLKWGSTNAYSEDASGKPVYDWSIVDKIIDSYLRAGAKPFVEIGMMPKALSTKAEPYEPTWIPGDKNPNYYIGWTYPPKDYAKWGELVHQWVLHEIANYGKAEVATWYWEVWNEPDIQYWHGTPEEYNKLYDYAVDGVKRALPEARVGGPGTTGPASAKAAAFLKQFLQHCDTGTNFATGKPGAPLDFITYHAKGRPAVVNGRVQMGIGKNAEDVEKGFQIVASFPKFQKLPIVLSESDPEGCAACSARVYPQNAYRNGPLYASYTAAMMKNIFELEAQYKTNMAGMLTWAFEFENQPYFDGFRTLATNGIDKPVLNVFRMAGLMRGNRVQVDSPAAIPTAEMIAKGVRGNVDVDALAVRGERALSVLVWNYHDDDVQGAEAERRLAHVDLDLAGLNGLPERVLLHHYRIDETHSNAWTLWKKMGSPQQPTAAQYQELQAAGQLQELTSPVWINVKSNKAAIGFQLPLQGVSLLQLTW